MFTQKILIAFGTAFGVALATALGVDIYEHQKVAKKIGIAAGDLKEAAVKDIQQGIVEKAVKDAAEDRVSTYVRNVKNEVMDDARIKLGEEVKRAVNDASEEIRKQTNDKIADEVSKIDISELKKSARDNAEAKILEKFDGNLEDLLEKFNDNLSNVQKIYGGIADAISKTNERDKGLKFTIG